jgi:hypothetical protein
MKAALPLLLSATLASAQAGFNTSAAANSSDVSNIQFNGNGEFNLADFNLGDLNLNELEAGGLDLGNIDLGDQDAIAEAILAMLNNLCLGNALDLNKILSFGFNNDVDLFFQLAQLEQLEQLGFLNLGGIQSLFSKGLALGGFNLGEYSQSSQWRFLADDTNPGVFKREIAEARKTMKRTKLRRGQKIKRQCPESGIALGAAEENTFTIATADPDAFATSTTTAVAAAATTEEIAFTIATADPDAPVASSVTVAAAATTSVTSAASVASASSTASSAAVSVAPAAGAADASAVSAASASAVPAAAASAMAAAPAAAVPAAAATSAAAAGAGDVENLSDLTR